MKFRIAGDPMLDLLNAIIFIILLYGFLPTYNAQYKNHSLKYGETPNFIFYGFFLILLSVLGFSDVDFFGYYQSYAAIRHGFNSKIVEPFYNFLSGILPNYFLWRLVVWGTAAILMLKTLKKLPVNTVYVLTFITLFYVFSFYKLRNALGFSVMFYGATLALTSHHKYGKRIIGIVLIALSFYLHKSMIISMALLSVYFIKFSKARINISLIAWPFLLGAVTLLLNSVVSGELFGSDDQGFASKAVGYASGEAMQSNLNGQIRLAFENLAIIFPLAYMTWKIVYKKIAIPKVINFFYKYWYVTCYIAYLFAFQDSSSWIYIRFNTMAYFPMCVVLGWYFTFYRRNVWQKAILIAALIPYAFSIFYLILKKVL